MIFLVGQPIYIMFKVVYRMERLFDKLILLICCGIVPVMNDVSVYTSIPIIIAVTLISVNIAFDYMKVHVASYVLYLILTLFCPPLIYFAPVICYDFFMESNMHMSLGGGAYNFNKNKRNALQDYVLYFVYVYSVLYIKKKNRKSA